MLKLIRYILSKRRDAKNKLQHTERLHMMSADDDIGVALWHCEEWLNYHEGISFEDRLNRTIQLSAPSAYELLDAVEKVVTASQKSNADGKVQYIRSLPSWINMPETKQSLDSWLVDEDGYFVDFNNVIKKLHDKLTIVKTNIDNPDFEEYSYHFNKKPRQIYKSVTMLIQHFL